jgi:CDP-diacylglycerol--serine O-phosphatidyltransferase
MQTIVVLIALVLGLLFLERISIISLCRHPKGREWVRSCPLLHPNVISTMRIPMGIISITAWHYGQTTGQALWMEGALLWFAFWMISDLTDGTIARHCELWTKKGEWLDPLSDKFMYFPALLYFALISGSGSWDGDPLLPLKWVLALVCFDSVGQASRLFSQKTAANLFGKAKTALITTTISLVALHQIFVTNGGQSPFEPRLEQLYDWMIISCCILAFLSFYCKVIPDNWYANTLTLANFGCGIGAIYQAAHALQDHVGGDKDFQAHLLKAFLLVFLGQFFDLFDGRLARKYGSTKHGPIFDDIADGTNFGAAIGMIIFTSIHAPLPYLALPVALIYCGCVVFRLYRFLNPPYPIPDGIFLGMPAPAGAMMAGSAILLFPSMLLESPVAPWIGIALVLFTSWLMISTLRYKHFGQRILPTLPKGVRLILFVLIVVFADISIYISHKNYALSFPLFCLITVMFYAIYGLDFWDRFSKRQPAPPPTKESP